MNILREVSGFALILLAWFNPLGLSLSTQIVFFVLGFDMISLPVKVLVFTGDYFLGLGIGWVLMLLVIAEIVTRFLIVNFLFSLIIKPLVVFVVLYLSGLSFEIAIIVAGIDLLLNMTKKWI